MKLEIIATGGTIDKIYADALSAFDTGAPAAPDILDRAGVVDDYTLTPLLRKDSLEMTDQDRSLILQQVRTSQAQQIIITHGTDTMVETARLLKPISDKTIVLTGAMQPAICRNSDADFNLGGALALVQVLPAGVYIYMNGQVLDPDRAQKNRDMMRFEARI